MACLPSVGAEGNAVKVHEFFNGDWFAPSFMPALHQGRFLQFGAGDAVLPPLIAHGDGHGDAVLLCLEHGSKPRPGPQFAVRCCGGVAFWRTFTLTC